MLSQLPYDLSFLQFQCENTFPQALFLVHYLMADDDFSSNKKKNKKNLTRLRPTQDKLPSIRSFIPSHGTGFLNHVSTPIASKSSK